MTILLVGLGAAVAALGTRIAALAFVAAAVLAARGPGLPEVGTWTAAFAAGWLLLGERDVRTLAVPALGAAAVLAAGSASNGAVVCGLWVVATAAAALCRGPDKAATRWALTLCLLDIPLIVAVATTTSRGFEGWPGTLRGPGSLALLASAAARATLAGGADDRWPLGGLLVVRAQTAVLVVFALASAGDGVAQGAVVAAAVGFAAAPLIQRRSCADVIQELSLFAIALASGRLGWGVQGWEWGALAAGTFMHHLRFIPPDTRASAFAELMRRSGGIGLPFLPVVLAELEGAARARGALGVVLAFSLLAGLAGRARWLAPGPSRGSSPGAVSVIDEVRAASVVACALVVALWAPVLTGPRPPAAAPVPWPSAWAAFVMVIAGLGAGSTVRAASPGRRPPLPRVPLGSLMTATVAQVDRVATERALLAAICALGAAATAMWVLGVARGFL